VLLTRQGINTDLPIWRLHEVTLYLHSQVRNDVEMSSIDDSILPIAGHEKSAIVHGD
jgi:hypothetical protein